MLITPIFISGYVIIQRFYVLIREYSVCWSTNVSMFIPDENKIHKLNDNLAMAVCGEPGDTIQFAEYISKNLQLYKMRNGQLYSSFSSSAMLRRVLPKVCNRRAKFYIL